MKDYYR